MYILEMNPMVIFLCDLLKRTIRSGKSDEMQDRIDGFILICRGIYVGWVESHQAKIDVGEMGKAN